MNKNIFSLFIAETITFRIKYFATAFFDGNIFPEGIQPSWKISEIPGVGGGGMSNTPWWCRWGP